LPAARPRGPSRPGSPAGTITPGTMTRDPRRLRRHGLIARIPAAFRCPVTDAGITRARFLTGLHDKFPRTGPAALARPRRAPPAPARTGHRQPLKDQGHPGFPRVTQASQCPEWDSNPH
jgi:hypothetical protein